MEQPQPQEKKFIITYRQLNFLIGAISDKYIGSLNEIKGIIGLLQNLPEHSKDEKLEK